MGAWGIGVFENDLGYDWLNEFIEHPSRELLEEVFEYVLNRRDFLDISESCAALVAAELVAARLGRASRDLPTNLDVNEILSFVIDETLIEAGRRAVGQILYLSGHSEVRDLWREEGAEEFSLWEKGTYNLIERLR